MDIDDDELWHSFTQIGKDEHDSPRVADQYCGRMARVVAASPPAIQPAPAPASGITLSKVWTVPARPKPGRKPAPDVPENKRKQQNREAQRTFRERRAQRVHELEGEMKLIHEQHAHEVQTLKAANDGLAVENARLRQELVTLRAERAATADHAAQSTADTRRLSVSHIVHPTSIPPGGSARQTPMTPPMEAAQVDNPAWSIDSEHLGKSVPLRKKRKIEQSCGFCSNGMPCVCEGEGGDSSALAIALESPADDPLAQVASNENGGCTGNPGSCSLCQRDSMSTLFCQSLAKRTSAFATSAEPRGLERRQKPENWINCSAAYQSLSRHPKFGDAEIATVVGLMRVRDGKGVDVESVREALRKLDRI